MFDSDHWSTGEDRPRVGKTVSPVIIVRQDSGGKVKAIDIVDGDGRVKVVSGGIKKASDNKADGTTSTVTVPSDKVWEVLVAQASFLMDANVADRAAALLQPTLGMGGIAGTNPAKQFPSATITLSSNQYGYVIISGRPARIGTFSVDNGANAAAVDVNPAAPFWINEGAVLQAILTANGQVTDKTGLDVLYREHDLEV